MRAYADSILAQDDLTYIPSLVGDEEGEAIIDAVKKGIVSIRLIGEEIRGEPL